MPYQSLINLYLAECARENKQLSLVWNRRIPDRHTGGFHAIVTMDDLLT